MNDHAKEVKTVFKDLGTSEKGLTQNQVKDRLKKYGKNSIKTTKRFGLLKIIFDQLNSFLIYILIFATIFSFVIGNFTDGVVILAIIILNSTIGSFQQYKAERAISSLKKLLVPTSKVVRDGKHLEVSSMDIVPGDILILSSGNKINADCRIIVASNLEVSEAVLTGESFPVSKSVEVVKVNSPMAERKNMLYTGTQVVKGTSRGVVIATGMDTEFGQIASQLQEIEPQKTPMQKNLDKFSKQLGIFILVLVGLLFVSGLIAGFEVLDMLLVSITLAIGAIPEGLPAVLAIAFAIASKSMSRKNVIIRRLPAVESLGSVTVICTDKTGTLTEEKMDAKEIFANNKFYTKKGKEIYEKSESVDYKKNKALYTLIRTALLCNNARFELVNNKYTFLGDPTEETLLRLGLDLGLNKKKLTEAEPRLKEMEFDSKRKMMSVLRDVGENNIIYSKGAIETILSNSSHELIDSKKNKLTEERRKEIMKSVKIMESKALRVLAFSYKEIGKKEKFSEKDLAFLGFVGMIDPPRKEVKAAIEETKAAGIEVKIITGDSLLTAKAIAEDIGIKGKAIDGNELEKYSDLKLLKEIDKIKVFARATPYQKLRILKILQQKNEIVAMTGDGVNDILALKAADVGISMGQRGTDVARDVSDVILVDDNFASIVEGIKQGRKTYDNIKKFIKYLLSVNFSQIFLVAFSLILAAIYGDIWILPLLPLQILWINLITDSFPALSLVFEKEENVMKTKPRSEKSILQNTWKFIIVRGIFAIIAQFAVYVISVSNALSPETIRSLVLATVIVFELSFIYSIRSEKTIFRKGAFSNKFMNYAVFFSFLATLILLYTPLSSVFGVVPLSLNNWLFLLPFGLSGIVFFELFKLIKKKGI